MNMAYMEKKHVLNWYSKFNKNKSVAKNKYKIKNKNKVFKSALSSTVDLDQSIESETQNSRRNRQILDIQHTEQNYYTNYDDNVRKMNSKKIKSQNLTYNIGIKKMSSTFNANSLQWSNENCLEPQLRRITSIQDKQYYKQIFNGLVQSQINDQAPPLDKLVNKIKENKKNERKSSMLNTTVQTKDYLKLQSFEKRKQNQRLSNIRKSKHTSSIENVYIPPKEIISKKFLQLYNDAKQDKFYAIQPQIIEILSYLIDFNNYKDFINILNFAGGLAVDMGNYDAAISFYHQLRILSLHSENIVYIIKATRYMAEVCNKTGYYSEALKLCLNALTYCWYSNNIDQELKIYDVMGLSYYYNKQIQEATYYHERYAYGLYEDLKSELRNYSRKQVNSFIKSIPHKSTNLSTYQLCFTSLRFASITQLQQQQESIVYENYQNGVTPRVQISKNYLQSDLIINKKIEQTLDSILKTSEFQINLPRPKMPYKDIKEFKKGQINKNMLLLRLRMTSFNGAYNDTTLKVVNEEEERKKQHEMLNLKEDFETKIKNRLKEKSLNNKDLENIFQKMKAQASSKSKNQNQLLSDRINIKGRNIMQFQGDPWMKIFSQTENYDERINIKRQLNHSKYSPKTQNKDLFMLYLKQMANI